jgi:hypothetical protein
VPAFEQVHPPITVVNVGSQRSLLAADSSSWITNQIRQSPLDGNQG